jgi:DNA polymerase-3 subunit delta
MTYKLYHGASQYLSLRAVKNDIQEYPDIKFQVLNADTTDSQSIFDTLGSPTLFSNQRGIIVKRLYKNKDKDRLIESIFKLLKSDTSTDIIYFWEDQKIRSITKYLKFFKEQSALEEYEELNKRSFMSWLKEELKANNLELDTNTQRILAEKSNYDPERCSNEIKKIKLDPENGTTNMVDTLENSIWNLIDAINNKDKTETMNILENLYSQNNDPNYILSMLARNLRLLTLVKHLNDQHKTFKEICSILRIPPFTLPQILDTAKKYENKNIVQIYKKLSNLDLQIKTGRIDGQLGLTLICPYL